MCQKLTNRNGGLKNFLIYAKNFFEDILNKRRVRKVSILNYLAKRVKIRFQIFRLNFGAIKIGR